MSAERPNILLITTDQQRFDGLSINGNRVLTTPNLDSWAASGVNFTRAYSTTPSCIAARRTLLTGMHGATHGLPGYQDGTDFNPPFTLPGLLGDAGYQTQLIGKLHQFPQRKRFGFDHLILSERLDDYPDSPYFGQNDYAEWLRDQGIHARSSEMGAGSNSRISRPYFLEERYHQTSWLTHKAIDFVTRKRDPSCPWFLHLSYWAPHPPLLPPQFYYDRYAGRQDMKPHIGSWVPPFQDAPRGLNVSNLTGPFSADDMRNMMAGYYGLINHIDDCLVGLMSRLFERGTSRENDKLWVIFTSDHGELLGDHHLTRKVLPYEGSTHVPFFIQAHHLPLQAKSSDALVCLEDVCPTVLDLAGVSIPKGMDGHSLAPILNGKSSSVRDRIFGEHGSGQAGLTSNHYLVMGRYKYCWFSKTHEEQLFDLEKDPWECEDLSGNAILLAPLRKAMRARLKGRKDYRYDLAKLKPLANQPPKALWG